MVKLVNVTDEYGKSVVVDMDTAKVINFRNADKKYRINVQMYEDNKPTIFWTCVEMKGIITDFDTKIKAWNGVFNVYARYVRHNKNRNDPDEKIYNLFVEHVRNNQERYFTKKGDWRRRKIVDKELLKELGLA